METSIPNDSTIEIEDITNREESEEEGEQNVETRQDITMADFVKQNYTTLKQLLEEHERTEKLKGVAEDVLNMARKAQASEGGLFYTPHDKGRTMPVYGETTGTDNAGSNSGAAQKGEKPPPKESGRKLGHKTLPRRTEEAAGARKVLFSTDDDIQILDEEENTEGKRRLEQRCRNANEPTDEDLVGPYQRRIQSRFTTRIATAPKPARLKMPLHIKTYDGLSDPDDHMSLFCAAAENHLDWTMPVWCHMFEQTLKGPARLWFNSLPPSSINSFEELQDKFETQFQHQRRYERDPVEIHNIKQGENESILDFLRRFNRESMEIGGATESMRVSGYMHAIRNKQLIEQLNRVVPKTMKEAEQRSRDFVRGKEAAALTEIQRKKDGRESTSWKKEGPNRRHSYPHFTRSSPGGNSPGGWRREQPKVPYARPTDERKIVFTALVKTPCEILATEAVAKKFTPPTPGKNMVGPQDKFCEYHQGTGHNTNECYQLRRKIEEAVQSGELTHLVKHIRTPADKNNRRARINVLGRRMGSETREIRNAPEPFMFCPIKEGAGSEEALVIQGRIEEIPIERMLVDTGADVDVMYEHYFWKLPTMIRRELRRTGTDLVTFDGRKCKIMGKMILPVSIGYFPKSSTKELMLYVVPGRSSADIILGRPGLRAFGAIPSTIHEVLMLPTNRGIAIVPRTEGRNHDEEQEKEGWGRPHRVHMVSQGTPEWKNREIQFAPMNECVPTDEALVVRGRIGRIPVPKILVDSGSSTEVMYDHFFETLDEATRAKKRGEGDTIEGFGGQLSWSQGDITLPLTIGNQQRVRTEQITFSIVKAPARHDIILGRPGLKSFGAIPSTLHSQLKFPTTGGIATVRGEKRRGECLHLQTGKRSKAKDPEEKRGEPRDEENKPTIGATLTSSCRQAIEELVRKYRDVFAWKPSDMTGIPRSIAEHKLKVRPGVSPVRQKKRNMAPDRLKAIDEEVAKLEEAGILREVTYQTWIANPVMVPKSDGTWRMCIDFKDINKACPKDNYPLPEIDLKVESLVGYKYKCFLDAYKGYHQIQMAKEDEEKTAFYTGNKLYCYRKMPFGLINAGATYQRLVDKVFAAQMGRNLEVYVDDLVIKSKTEEDLIRDIKETFETLRSVNMKLNPKKCTFGAEEGRFLGHVITEKGLKACPEKVGAIVKLNSPKTLKEVQSLNGKLAALSRYFSKLAEKSLPFFKTLQKCINKNDFRWTNEAEKAFNEVKTHIAQLPELKAPIEGKELFVYLAAAQETISAVLVVEQGKHQHPVYFVSKALAGAEIGYAPMEKLAYALVYAARRLRRYFQAHQVVVLTELPLRDVLYKPEKSGRLAKWAIELGEHTIEYRPRTSVKGQVVADFIAEVPLPSPPEQKRTEGEEEGNKVWKLFTDGASNKGGCGAGVVLVNPDGAEFVYALRFNFISTNNEAEYEALLAGLRLAQKMKITHLEVKVDSALVANQVLGEYATKGETMEKYKQKATRLLAQFIKWEIRQIPREQNEKADLASRIASDEDIQSKKGVLVEVLEKKSIEGPEINEIATDTEPNWMSPIKEFLTNGKLPTEATEARRIKLKSPRYVVQEGVLYRRSYLMPLLRCVGPTQANYILREVHEGACGLHQGPRMLVAKINNLGYFWPGMNRDAMELTQKCSACQKHSPVPRIPKSELIPIMGAWPFHQWGIDIVGPFPQAPGRVKFLIVAIDYFTKWVEAKPVARITGKDVKNFIWENIVCRYGIPGILISDNGKQFAENPLKKWCTKMKIKQKFTSVAHPQANGQVERANRSLVEGIKKRLTQEGGRWTDHLSHVLWAHRTAPKTSNGETPFSLTYGTEAVVPAEIGIPTIRSRTVDIVENEGRLRTNLDMLEERRELASINEANYKRKMEQYYNQRVKPQTFKAGEYVWRKNEASLQEPSGKLSPNWEGPYEVCKVQGGGSYKLKKMTGEEVPRTWNVANLRRCYI